MTDSKSVQKRSSSIQPKAKVLTWSNLANLLMKSINVLVSIYQSLTKCFPHPSEFSSLAQISDLDAFKTLKRLKPSISVAVNDIIAFVIKSWSDIFVPYLKHIFNQHLSQKYFPTLQKKGEII